VRRKERDFDDIESSEYAVRKVLDAVLDNRAANRIKIGRAAVPTRGMTAIPHVATGRQRRRIAREDGFRFVCERTGFRLTPGNNGVSENPNLKFTRSRCLHAFNICERSRKAGPLHFQPKG